MHIHTIITTFVGIFAGTAFLLADPIMTLPGHYQQEYTFKIKPTPTNEKDEDRTQALCEFTTVDGESDGRKLGIYYFSDGIADYLKTLKSNTIVIRWSKERPSGPLKLDSIGDLELSELPKEKKGRFGTFTITEKVEQGAAANP